MKYQVQRTICPNGIADETAYILSLVGRPVKDLKLAKSMLALDVMKTEREGLAAKYCIIKIDDNGDMVGTVKLQQRRFA